MNCRSQNSNQKAVLSYDQQCAHEFSLLHSRVGQLFINIDIGCPYGLPYVATFHQATFAPLGERAMELFLAAGYRRNGNCLYTMHCRECSACQPIRLYINDFQPRRNQRRALKRNQDLTIAAAPLRCRREHIDLCERFLQERYPKESNSALGYYRDFFFNSIVTSVQLEYRIDDRLVGTSVVDIGHNWLNAVYFYFDPEESRRSLGTYNILYLIELCRKWEVEYLYLGYLIDSVPAMNYKKHFRPHFVFVDGKWQQGT